MAFVKRIVLFLLTNLAVIIVLNIVLAVIQAFFWINLSWYGLNIPAILTFAATVWFTGAIVSLFMSKWTAKRAYNIQIFNPDNLSTLSSKEKIVYDIVRDIANRHGITTPEVGVYEASDINAFATGASKNSSLVAVSSWLLDKMTPAEIEGVVAHEMAHILNGDMVTMTLIQWVVNTFVIFLSRIIANLAQMFFSKGEEQGPWAIYYIVSIVLEICFSILASTIVMWFSRYREYRADEGSAKYVGKEKMIAALQALKRTYETVTTDNAPLATYRISSREKGGIAMLFSSHPPLDARISNLENMRM